MAHYPKNKQFFLIIDTETTQENTVADFGALVCDKQGRIYEKCAVLVKNHFDTKELFFNSAETKNALWSLEGAKRRKTAYNNMLNKGLRQLASVQSINNWLDQAFDKYGLQLELTAYNLPFDIDKCNNTGIILEQFINTFDMWAAAMGNICQTRTYLKFCLDNHLFTNRTDLGNSSIKTSAESVYSYLNNNMLTEPHTAIEDCIIESKILNAIIKRKKWRDNIQPYSWQNNQLKDLYKVK